MALILPFAVVGAALAALLMSPPGAPILGLAPGQFAAAAGGGALVLWILIGAARRAGWAGVARVVISAATWALAIVSLTGVYAYRFELSDVADRVMSEIAPGEPTVGRGGEVIVNRRIGGEFVVRARVNDRPVAFLFDTGASMVVLTAEDAARVGIDTRALAFDVDVVTANGAAKAAPTRLDRIAVGSILLRNVRALVARPGAMSESLLGMSFLENLQSYTVERGRLVMRAK